MASKNLSFTPTTDGWVSAAETVSSDFNVHIEASKPGSATVYMKTAGGGYTKATVFPITADPTESGRFVGEGECSAIVYNKSVIVVSGVEPNASNGGILTTI